MRPSSDFPPPDLNPDPEGGVLVPGEEAPDPQEEVIARLDLLQGSLSKQRQDWINARAAKGLDRRWAEDLDQYNGIDPMNRLASSMMESVEQGYPSTRAKNTPTRSTVFVQATRFQTNTGAARVCDVSLPTDESNFDVKCTPIPNMPSLKTPVAAAAAQAAGGGTGMGDMQAPAAPGATPSATGGSPPPGMSTAVQQAANGQGAAPGQGAPAVPLPADLSPEEQQILDQHAEATKRAKAMQGEIADCFAECDFNAEARRSQFDRALFGTAVMMGPIVHARTGKKWTRMNDAKGEPIWKLEIVEELKPASFRIDPTTFYPDPDCGENVQNGRGAWRFERKTKKQIRALAKQPGYMSSQLLKVLGESPEVGRALQTTLQQEERAPATGDAYEHWIYWGEAELEDLVRAGVLKPDATELDTVSVCIEMINSTIIRAYFNPLPDGALPYDMVPWERIPGSVWGYGVPYLMRAQQRVINSAWRMLLDNAGVSAGPQIILREDAVTPADQDWTITSRKVWYASDQVDDVNKAFAVFNIDSHQQELANIIELAQKLAEAESAVPMDMNQQGATPETLGALQLLMNSKNVVLRRLVKDLDDYLIKPHVRRYYDYLMEYSEREDIKGDYQVVALGASELVVRDIQNQAIVQLLAMGSNPVYAVYINKQKIFEKALRAQHIEPSDIMNTPAEVQAELQRQQQNQQPDPRLAAAEKRADADIQRTHAQVQMNDATLETKKTIAQAELQVELESLRIQREIEMMRLAQKENLTLEQIRAQLAAVAIQERSKQDMAANKLHIEGARDLPVAA
jgi:hypothetical protein